MPDFDIIQARYCGPREDKTLADILDKKIQVLDTGFSYYILKKDMPVYLKHKWFSVSKTDKHTLTRRVFAFESSEMYNPLNSNKFQIFYTLEEQNTVLINSK